MENAADALKISFAVFVFIVALALTFYIIGVTRKTADVVLYHADKTNFYELSEGEDRIVSAAEVVTTLYRIAGESIVVRIKNPSPTGEDIVISGKSEGEIDELLANGLLNQINTFSSNGKFIEEFAEVDYSGIYKTAEDGTKVTIADGGTAMYITYIPVKVNDDGTYTRLS